MKAEHEYTEGGWCAGKPTSKGLKIKRETYTNK